MWRPRRASPAVWQKRTVDICPRKTVVKRGPWTLASAGMCGKQGVGGPGCLRRPSLTRLRSCLSGPTTPATFWEVIVLELADDQLLAIHAMALRRLPLELLPEKPFRFTRGRPSPLPQLAPRFWLPAVKRAGLAPLGVHELRHTAAANMVDQGAHVISVQRRMGHTDVGTTLGLYGHLYPEQDDALTTWLDQIRESACGTYRGQEVIKPG